MARGYIVVNEEMCKSCELCVNVCPFDLIHIARRYNEKGYQPAELVDPAGKCTGCALCATICPEAAIIVFREMRRERVDREEEMREAA